MKIIRLAVTAAALLLPLSATVQAQTTLRPLDGHLVACHFAEQIKAGQIVARETAPGGVAEPA